jgi:hypothetical protein
MAAKNKRPTFASAAKKLPGAGRAGVARAVDGHRRAEAKDARSKATFDLSADLIAELRAASVIAGETLAAIAERGLTSELERLRNEIMDGNPFPMPIKTRKGRPPKA